MNGRTRTLAGHIGVDSGQMLLADPCYLKDWKGDDYAYDGQGADPAGSFSYSGACATTLREPEHGVLSFSGRQPNPDAADGAAFVTHTGYGDGLYPVYVEKDASGRVLGVYIDFDPQDDDEEGF